ncbi:MULTISPECIES: hypothetical protein [unclassified Streptomyces]
MSTVSTPDPLAGTPAPPASAPAPLVSTADPLKTLQHDRRKEHKP